MLKLGERVFTDRVEAFGLLAVGTTTTLADSFNPPGFLVSEKSQEDSSALFVFTIMLGLDVMFKDSPVIRASRELGGTFSKFSVATGFTHYNVRILYVRERNTFGVDVYYNVEHLDFNRDVKKLDSDIFVIFSIATSAGKVVSADTDTSDLLLVEGVANSDLVFTCISSDDTDIQVNVVVARPVHTKDNTLFDQVRGKFGKGSTHKSVVFTFNKDVLVALNEFFDFLLDDHFSLSPPDVAVSLVEAGQLVEEHPTGSTTDIELVVTSSNVDVPHSNSVPSPDTEVLNVELLMQRVAPSGDGDIEHIVAITVGVVSSASDSFVDLVQFTDLGLELIEVMLALLLSLSLFVEGGSAVSNKLSHSLELNGE